MNSQHDPHRNNSFYAHRTQFPDILSAPAPVLRDDDLLIDGETVAMESELPSPAMSPLTSGSTPQSAPGNNRAFFASAPPATYDPYYQQSPPPQQQQQQYQFATPPPQQQPSAYRQSYTNGSNSNNHQSIAPAHRQSQISRTTPPSSSSSFRQSSYGDPTVASMVLSEAPNDPIPNGSKASTRPPEVARMRQRRKVATAAAGVAGGIVGLAVLGPVGAVAGGVGGALLTKHTGKRMERKQTERIAAARAAQEEARYGQAVPALQEGATGLT